MFERTKMSSYFPWNLMIKESNSVSFETNIKELWNLETIGIKQKYNQQRDKFVTQKFKDTIN